MNFYGQVFSIQEELFRGSSYVISRGIQNSDQKPIIIKYLNSEIQEGNENLKLKNEFYIHSQRKLNFSIKAVDFIDDTFLILEDFKGISLSDFIKNRKLDVTDFLFIALAMTECLIEIHENNIIHKDIKPANFIINENTKELKLTDFGISTLFQKEYVSSSEIKLEGTIQYISPEQTGRTGKPIDYRTDLYSLGISFYEMLTGRLPFATNDINQILHFHLAQIPDSPKKYNPDIPTILAALIQKLISKDPIARYQSANGLKFDLIEIQRLFEKNEEILSSMPFQLGANDFSDKFIISEKLYGREKEIQILQESFLDTLSIHQSNRFLLITGYSGIGKSSLISELNIPIQEKKGFLISGKFEQYQRNIPFFAISQSFADFIKQLLSREKSEIEIWKRDIQTAVGSIGKVITDVIPELELLIGVQEDVPEVSTEQGMNRFSYAFLQFVKACAKLEHPIVLFLDDLQWADSGSLFLLEQLLYEPDLYYILIIGAYRNNEVNSSSSFHFFLSNLEKENYQFKTIHLGNLEKKAIRDLLVDTLHSKSESIEELSDLIYSKTGGNPFFTKQFLFNLQDESFIYFKENEWRWEKEKIYKLNISENVIELMLRKIKKLSDTIQSLLGIAACIGNQFELSILIEIYLEGRESLIKNLETCIQDGLITPVGESYKLFSSGNLESNYYFEFVHDKIQQAAYQLISDSKKKEIHLEIGRYLLKRSNEKEINESLFDILGHLNYSIDLVHEDEKYNIALLNLKAGKQAKLSIAYKSALQYFQNCLNLLSDKNWNQFYSELFECIFNLVETEFLLGNYQSAIKYFEIGMDNANSRLDKAKLYNLRIALFNTQGDYQKAIESGLDGLRLYDFKIPSKINDLVLFKEYLKVKNVLGENPILFIQSLSVSDNQEELEKIKLSLNILDSIYLTNPSLGTFITINAMLSVIKIGNSYISPIVYASFAAFLCNINEYKLGYNLGKYALENISESLKAKCYHIFCSLINHWSRSVRDTFPLQSKGFQIGIETGDVIYACYNAFMYIWNHFFAGVKLDATLKEGNKYFKAVEKLKNRDSEKFILILLNHLREITETRMDYSDSEILEMCEVSQTKTPYFIFYLLKFQKYFITEQYENAAKMIPEILAIQDSVTSTMYLTEFRFYYCLNLFIKDDKSEEANKQIEKELKQWELWAKNCEPNYQHKYFLLQAEWCKANAKIQEAMEYYDKAIYSSKEYDFIQNSALASKLAGMFYLSLDRGKIADLYFSEAFQKYKNWGSLYYSNFIKSRYLKNFYEPSSSDVISQKVRGTTSSSVNSVYIDINSILKASRIISSDVRFDSLSKNFLQVIIENAGAERGVLLISESNEFFIYSEANVNGEFNLNKRKQDSSILPTSVLRYVELTKESVVLHNASNEKRFQRDEFIIEKKVKSMVCLPIMNQNQMLAILYLENNLFERVFTEERIETIQMLSSQAAVSIQNSILYQSMEEKVKERTNELKTMLDKVNELKRQQDADYYLTSLLIQPLSNNNLNSRIKIEFLVLQKKEFEFRKESNFIGGDICISDEIVLRKKKMIVFVNADAMGKSLQGAGGTIVLGSVFKSILERTKMDDRLQSQFPELWLKNAFSELHKVFQTFEGFMLVSAIIGLIEEETGFMYFINSEHPHSVLYRDGKASFIPKTQSLFKMGSLGGDDSIVIIQTFQTYPGDIIINGSDGREDLIKDYTEHGKPNVYHEEKLFLDYVEEAKGDLHTIKNLIVNSWELYDDLSLLRVEIPENLEIQNIEKKTLFDFIPDYLSLDKNTKRIQLLELYNQNLKENKNLYLYKLLSKEFVKFRDYEIAANCARIYCESNPSDLRMLKFYAFILEKIGEFDEADLYKQRLLLRAHTYSQSRL